MCQYDELSGTTAAAAASTVVATVVAECIVANTSHKFHDDTHYSKLKVRSDSLINAAEDCLQSSTNLCKYYINLSKHASHTYLCTCNDELNAKRMQFCCRKTKIHFRLSFFLFFFYAFYSVILLLLKTNRNLRSIVFATRFSLLSRPLSVYIISFLFFRSQDKGLANDVVTISNFSSMFSLCLFC